MLLEIYFNHEEILSELITELFFFFRAIKGMWEPNKQKVLEDTYKTEKYKFDIKNNHIHLTVQFVNPTLYKAIYR